MVGPGSPIDAANSLAFLVALFPYNGFPLSSNKPYLAATSFVIPVPRMF
jgi:hypothetical protein